MEKKIKTLGVTQRPGKGLTPRPGTNQTKPTGSSIPLTQTPLQRQPSALVKAPNSALSSQKKSVIPIDQAVAMNKPAGAIVDKMTPEVVNQGIQNLVKAMRNMVGSFAILQEAVIAENIVLANRGMTMEERTVPYECAEYLISNSAFIFTALVAEGSVREAFVDAVMYEQELDKLPEAEKEKKRKSMRDPRPYPSKGSMVIGVSTFSAELTEFMMQRMTVGYEALSPYSDEFDSMVDALDNDAKIQLGFVFSNFMYLIRAFTHNDLFMAYVITMIDNSKKAMGLI